MYADTTIDFSKIAAVMSLAVKPKDKGLMLFIGASIPLRTHTNPEMLEKLNAKYSGRLNIKPSGQRISITLLCKSARNLREVGNRADRLKRNIFNILKVRTEMVMCGHIKLCEALDVPEYLPVLHPVSVAA